MSTSRHVLRYDAGLSAVDTFRLLDARPGIFARLRIGGIEIAAEIDLRWHAETRNGAAFVRPYDSDGTLWITGPVDLGGGLLKRELQLERVPQHASEIMRGW